MRKENDERREEITRIKRDEVSVCGEMKKWAENAFIRLFDFRWVLRRSAPSLRGERLLE